MGNGPGDSPGIHGAEALSLYHSKLSKVGSEATLVGYELPVS
jgi:hypothetical protein